MDWFVISDSYRLNGRTGGAVESVQFEKKGDAVLCAARNEYASFQIALKDAPKPISAVDIQFKAGDAEFGNVRFTVFLEWFHQLRDQLVPDLLIPWDRKSEFAVDESIAAHYDSPYSVFWVDAFIPRHMPVGAISGEALVLCGGVELAAVPISIDVHKATLCDETLLHADLNNYGDNLSMGIPSLKANDNRFDDGTYFDTERQYYRLSHEHRAVFHLLPYSHSGYVIRSFAPVTEGRGKHIRVVDWTLFDEHFGPYFDGSAFEGSERGPIPMPFAYLPFCFDWPASYEKWNEPGYRIENRRILLEFIRHFEEKGWTKTVFEIFTNHKKRYRFYPYDGDEVRHEHDVALTHIMGEIFCDLFDHSDVNIILRTDASWGFHRHYNTELTKIIKMWAVGCGLLQFVEDSYQYMKKQGNILWAYGGATRIDGDMTALFEWPMRCLQNDWGGFLYWNCSSTGADFMRCPESDGGHTLFYPAYPLGVPGGVLPSIRLKFLRNAMQIADMIKMYEGTWTFHHMNDAVNEIYGISKDKWYSPVSEILDIDPHMMTNEMIGIACREGNHPSENATPELPGAVKRRILEMADSFTGGQSVWR